MRLGEYVRQYREAHSLSMRDFAKIADTTSGYVSMLENNKNPATGKPLIPSVRTYRKIATATGISFDELMKIVDDDVNLREVDDSVLSGYTLTARARRVGYLYQIADDRDRKVIDTILAPYKEKVAEAEVEDFEDEGATVIASFPKQKVKKRRDGFAEVTVFEDQLPAAGLSSYFDEPRSHIEQYPLSLIPTGTSFAVPIAGDSMEPEYKNGATVFVQSTPRIGNGDVGLFSLNGAPFIKQLVVDDEKHEVRLHSLNEKYADIAVREFDDLRTFGKVLGSYSF